MAKARRNTKSKSKNKKKYNPNDSLLYPLLYARGTGKMQWLTTYAWFQWRTQWYLVKYRTPDALLRFFPFLMSYTTHKAWPVDFDPFKDKAQEFSPRQKFVNPGERRKNTSIGTSAGILIGPGLAALMTGFFNSILPSDIYPSRWTAILIEAGFALLTYIIVLGILWLFWGRRIRKWWQQYVPPKDAINEITSQPSITVKMHIPVNAGGWFILGDRIFLFLAGAFVPWLVFIAPFTFNFKPDSLADLPMNGLVVAGGIAMAVFALAIPSVPGQTSFKEIRLKELNGKRL